MSMKPKKSHALLAAAATGASIAAVFILIRSAMRNNAEMDVLTTAIALVLMSFSMISAFYVRRKRKEEEFAASLPQEEEIDEEFEAFLDKLYDMEREDEFYSCLDNDGPIEDYEQTKQAFEKIKSESMSKGSTEYIWRTRRDLDVCIRCRRNNGKRIGWNDTIRGDHPGCAPGCRCLPEPVMPQLRTKTKSAEKNRQKSNG